MDDFELVFYRKANGDCPVSDFLSSLNKVMRFKLLHQLDLLELYGNNPKGDFTKPVGEGIFELRAQNRTDITRIMFFFDKNKRIILTNGFIKKTQKLPLSELETSKRYRADYLSREAKRNENSKNTHTTIGPQWRPKLDEIVADAENRSKSAGGKEKETSKSKDYSSKNW